MTKNGNRQSPESLLAKLKEGEQAKLRVYIGAAPGVGKTYQMLEDAHLLKKQGADIVVAAVETHGREDTRAMIGELECVPMRRIEYRGVTLEEMDVDAVLARHPAIAIVDELAHTNVPGSKNSKRYQDVMDLLSAGISVISAVNIQHLESLNDVVNRTTGVRVRETVPDYFLRRADEVVNVDVSVATLRTRLRQGKIYDVVKLKSARVAGALIYFARREGITQVVFGQTSRSRWDILLHGSIINRFLHEVRDATVQVVPLERKDEDGRMREKDEGGRMKDEG